MDEKLVLIAAAVGVVFLPQIMALLKGFAGKSAPAPDRAGPQSRSVGSDPADWIADLYALQKVLIANGQKDAAELVSQSMVKIIGAGSTPAQNGGAKK